jgi:23S rRNA (cytosine1962-C5)-methyltransferase
MFQNRLAKVYRHLSRQAKRQQVSCFRIYDHDLPEIPFCIEQYGDRIYLAEYKTQFAMSDQEHDSWLLQCKSVIGGVTGVSESEIYLRERKRKAGRLDQYEKINDEKLFFTVEEGGLNFRINLTDYLDTGLFLDHRITRSLIREEAKNKHVLNLFCYTGSFSVYAAAGGCSSSVSVDLSKTYLEWAEENMRINNLSDQKKHRFIHADVKQYLDTLPENFYDLVIMDPPTFSNSKRMNDFLDIQRDHAELVNKTFKSMKPGGILYFSTNFSRFVLDTEKIKAGQIKDITRLTTPFDFQRRLFRYCFKMIR